MEDQPAGIAWNVRGVWRVAQTEKPLATGDAILPGSLLQPDGRTTPDSITILLPDGQRILYECFTVNDCARGFRVPALYNTPDPFAVDMLTRIHAILSEEPRVSRPDLNHASRAARDEAVVVLDSDHVEVRGLAARLSNGRYAYELHPLNPAFPHQSRIVFEKSTAAIILAVPAPGLYDATIVDSLNTPRVDLFIAAVPPAQAPSLMKSFRRAGTLMSEWNEDYQGWPIHEFQRAFLESLMLDVRSSNSGARGRSLAAGVGRAGATAEPAYSPRPGVFDGNTAVTLRCPTPGAIIHFTVDNSQPTNSSTVYRAPIIVKGTELTIKAFSTAPGKVDSAVVTGIFRIKQE